ncbi:hypothetical protein ACM64Y_03175 [Novispirillum sp. DQ9]|uniref:hypothetical protein n=1 Tax=Novispirillum sp. DQ9 TaxID=3398612 RepID=UPI003C7E8743
MQVPEQPVRHIDLARAKAMPLPGQPGGPVKVEMTDEQKAELAEFIKNLEPDPAEREKRLAEQRQIKAHTIFTVGGKIIALQEANGWSMSKDQRLNAMGVFDKEPEHLSGRALADHRAKAMEKALRSLYGDSLKVHDFADDPNAPTNGQLEPALWHGKSLDKVLSKRAGTRTGLNPLLALTGGTISLFHGRRG